MPRKNRVRIVIAVCIVIALSGCNNGQQNKAVPSPEVIESSIEPSALLSDEPTDIPTEPTYVPDEIMEQHDLEWARAEFDKEFFEPNVIEPIQHTITKRINNDLNEFVFTLYGFYGCDDSFARRMINAIEIRESGGEYYQKIEGLSTATSDVWEDYGFSFEDWNSDGFLDIQLRIFPGGAMRNEPSRFWLWDNSQKMYVENEQLAEISDFSRVYFEREEDERVRSYTRNGGTEYGILYFEYINREFVEVEREEVLVEVINGTRYETKSVKQLIDGEMKLVEEIKTKIDD